MARKTLHRISGLLVLLAVALLSAAPANAVTSEQGAYRAGSFDIARPDRVQARGSASEDTVCVHVAKRSHESCPACSTSFVMSIVSRIRPKVPGPRQKTGNLSFRDIEAPPPARRGAARVSAAYGSLVQANDLGTSIFARTNRLRI